MAAPHVVSWPGVCVVIVSLACILIYRLLAERGRRKTLVELCRNAGEGTVVVLGRGPGGPEMRVQVGAGPRQPSLADASRQVRAAHGAMRSRLEHQRPL